MRWPSPGGASGKAPPGRRWSDRVLRGPSRGRRAVWVATVFSYVLNGYVRVQARMTSTGAGKRPNSPGGVDISNTHLDVYVGPAGQAARVPNDAAGFKALIAWVEGPVRAVTYEPTGRWHRAFEEVLLKAGLPLVRVNPLHARRFAQAIGQRAKTDAVDARVLAPTRSRWSPSCASSSCWPTHGSNRIAAGFLNGPDGPARRSSRPEDRRGGCAGASADEVAVVAVMRKLLVPVPQRGAGRGYARGCETVNLTHGYSAAALRVTPPARCGWMAVKAGGVRRPRE